MSQCANQRPHPFNGQFEYSIYQMAQKNIRNKQQQCATVYSSGNGSSNESTDFSCAYYLSIHIFQLWRCTTLFLYSSIFFLWFKLKWNVIKIITYLVCIVCMQCRSNTCINQNVCGMSESSNANAISVWRLFNAISVVRVYIFIWLFVGKQFRDMYSTFDTRAALFRYITYT